MVPPFNSKSSTLFIIGTPLQAICAVEAIRDLKIDHYRFIVMIFYDNNRLDQTKAILDLYGITYSVVVINAYSFIKYLIKAPFKRKKFDRLFVGDYFVSDTIFYSLMYLKNESAIVYLDDGNLTIPFFNGALRYDSIIFRFKRILAKFLCSVKSISLLNNFYTMYSDLAPNKYNVRRNSLSHLIDKSKHRKQSVNDILYFIGTFTIGYAIEKNIGCDVLKRLLFEKLLELKSKYKKIIYIPHGRDTDIDIPEFCMSHGIEYKKLNTCIELYLLQKGVVDADFVGFSSSALYTIKLMLPNASVYNYVINSGKEDPYLDIDDYYSKQGINNICIHNNV